MSTRMMLPPTRGRYAIACCLRAACVLLQRCALMRCSALRISISADAVLRTDLRVLRSHQRFPLPT